LDITSASTADSAEGKKERNDDKWVRVWIIQQYYGPRVIQHLNRPTIGPETSRRAGEKKRGRLKGRVKPTKKGKPSPGELWYKAGDEKKKMR